MKKLLSILMLLVAIVTGAWATDQTYTVEGPAASKRYIKDNIMISGGSISSKKIANVSSQAVFYLQNGTSYAPLMVISKAQNIKSVEVFGNRDTSGNSQGNAFTVSSSSDAISYSVPTTGFSASADNNSTVTSVTSLTNVQMIGNNQSYATKFTVTFTNPVMAVRFVAAANISIKSVKVTYDDAILPLDEFCEVHMISTTEASSTNCTFTKTNIQSGDEFTDTEETPNTYYFTKSSGTYGYIDLGAGKTFKEGDEFWFEMSGGGSSYRSSTACGLILNKENSTSSATTIRTSDGIPPSQAMYLHYVTKSTDPWVGEQKLYIIRTSSNDRLYRVTMNRAPSVPTLTGAWKIGETDVTGNTAVAVQGSTPAPTMPTFTVGATSGTPTSSDYQVAYEETGDEGIFTYTDGVPTGISTANAGSATITATLTTKDNTKYLTPETNTFTYEVSISAASAPSINVSGTPAEVVKVGTEVTLTATAAGVPTPTITWYNGSDEAVATVEGTVLAYPVPTTTAGTYTFYAVASNGVEPNAISAVQTVVVKEQVATPTFTPNGGYFQESQSVTIACDGADAIVYSTDNGETWTSYTEALNITETTTVLAKATKEGYIDSETASATFTKLDAQTTVSTAKTWDWDTFTTSEVKMIEEKGHDIIMSNVPKYGYTIAFPEGFDAQAILFNGEYPVRTQGSNKVGGAVYLKINTTVAGTLTVTYADNGNNNRYLRVTDSTDTPQDGPTSSSTTDYKTFTCAVAAGEVKLAGYDGSKDTYIRFNKIVFTPFAAQNITVGTTGFATIGLPFATTVPEGVTAYAVESVSDSKVKMSSAIDAGTTIPANKGFVIVAAPNTYSFAPVASSSYEDTDLLEATGINEKAATEQAPIYVLTVTDATNKKIGFKKATTGSLGAYKAYLPGTVSNSNSLSVSFDEETAINGIAESEANAEAPVKVIKNGKLFIGDFNVAGQQVK